MSVEIPKAAVAFGSVAPPQGDIKELRVHLGCTREVSSFECLMQNWNKKYSPGEANAIEEGVNGHIDMGRGSSVPTIMHCRAEKPKYESTAVTHFLRVTGRCWGEKLFRRRVTKTYENKKGEEIVKDLIDYYVGLSHVRNTTELIENTDTTYTKLEYEDTPVFDILKYIARTADKAGVIGFDFRVAPDGKFEFFPRNSKTSPVSLSEKIEWSAYWKDVHRIRNKITIKGAADKSVPSDKDNWTEGIVNHLLSDDAEKTCSYSAYHLMATVLHDPSGNQRINIKTVELQARVGTEGATGYYKITYQKEGGSETNIVTDQAFTNTAYQLKQHTGLNVWSDGGKDLTIRYYVKLDTGLAYTKEHRAIGDVFNENWSAVSGEISLDSSKKVKGTLSIKTYAISLYYAALIMQRASAVNANLYPLLSFWLYRESSFNGNVNVILYDSSDRSAAHFFTIGADEWFQKQFKVGEENADIWDVESGFDWTQIKKVRFDCWFTGAGTGSFWVDGLFFGGRRYSSTQADLTSQQKYSDGEPREYTETDEELYSDNECELRAKALLAYLKDPSEHAKIISTVIDYGNTPLLPADKIPVSLPNENVDKDFRISNVEYYIEARTQTLEITIELGCEQPLLADYLYALRSKTDHLSRHKIARLL